MMEMVRSQSFSKCRLGLDLPNLSIQARKLFERRSMICLDLFLSDHVGNFDACERGCGRMEDFKTQSWAGDFLDETVIS